MKFSTQTLSALGVKILFLVTFTEASLSKLLSFDVPPWFLDSFSKTFLVKIPGLIPFSFYAIALTELAIAGLFASSVIKQFLGKKTCDSLTSAGLILAQFLFIALSFGQRLTGNYTASAQLFFYSLFSLLALYVLQRAPENCQSRDSH